MILVLTDLWPPFPGGAETLIRNLTRVLAADSQQVVVLTGYEIPDTSDPYPITRADIGIGPTHDEGWAVIARAIDATCPNVILTHHLYAYEFEQELAATGIPVVQVVLNNRRLHCAAMAVYISEWVRVRAGEFMPTDMTIRPWASPGCVAPAHGDAIGFVKPIPHKGVETVYAIAEQMPDRSFVVLRGEWQDLEILCDLPNVRYMEPVDSMAEFYAGCRLILMPSRSEDAGTIAQEACANGLPCISSNVGGLPETNGGGVRLDPFDLGGWLETIRNLDDPAVYAAVVARQRSYALRLGTDAALAEFARRVAAISDGVA